MDKQAIKLLVAPKEIDISELLSGKYLKLSIKKLTKDSWLIKNLKKKKEAVHFNDYYLIYCFLSYF